MARNRAVWIIAAILAVSVYGSEPRRQSPVTTNEYANTDLALNVGAATPPGCRALKSDEGFPTSDAWAKALPGVEPMLPQSNGMRHPDYRLVARSAADVERAVAFAASHNVRISIINTGHDYMARNDAPSGLLLDVSRLSGVITHSDWKPRPGGDPRVYPKAAPNIVTPANGKQAAVTFGAGLVGSKVNELIKESKMFVVSGGARMSSHSTQFIAC
jgi:FAD binding domain